MNFNPSERLKKHNASAVAGETARECISLYHSSFSQDWHLTNWNGGPFSANVRGGSVSFVQHPFTFRPPSDAATGRFDVEIDFFNPADTFMSELRLAAAYPEETIEVEYNVYLEAASDSEIAPFVMQIISVPFTENNATAIATRPNIVNRKFPYMVYRPETHPGLDR